ncbi:50S ribosomal protein L37ae [Candidatus Woesearchaeota archaeon]|nr:50S ribosomal protein L37ae [Candidatus Woesearchaeota archaeon]
MAKTKTKSTAKRFGARYGRTIRNKIALIEAEQKRRHRCPYCQAVAVRRLSAGIWSCAKCGAKFTGRAYTPAGVKAVAEAGMAPLAPAPEEQEEDDFEETYVVPDRPTKRPAASEAGEVPEDDAGEDEDADETREGDAA